MQCLIQCTAGKPQRRCSNRCPEHIQCRHCHLKSLTRFTNALGCRDTAISELQARQRVWGNHIYPLCDLQPYRVRINDKSGDTTRPLRLTRAGKNDIHIGDTTIRNPGFLAVQYVVIAIQRCRTLHRSDIEPASGSDKAKAAIFFPDATAGKYACFCACVPNRLIAPDPSPCIAKEKSASPEWRASVSRSKQIARVSITSLIPPYSCPAIACRSQPPSPSCVTRSRQA